MEHRVHLWCSNGINNRCHYQQAAWAGVKTWFPMLFFTTRCSLPSFPHCLLLCSLVVGSQLDYRRVWVAESMPGWGVHVNTAVVNCILLDLVLILRQQQNVGNVSYLFLF